MATNRASWILSSSSSIVSYILFYIMSSLRELRVATFTPDLLRTCSQNLLENGTNSYKTCPACEQNDHTQSDEFDYFTEVTEIRGLLGIAL